MIKDYMPIIVFTQRCLKFRDVSGIVLETTNRLYSRSAESPPRTRLGWHG